MKKIFYFASTFFLLLTLFACVTAKASYYDLIVIGSDPESVSAAVSGARLGLKTILISRDSKVGGLMTLGGLNSLDMCYGPQGEILTRGIFQEFYDQIEGDSFDIKTAENVFNKLLNEAQVEVIMNVDDFKPILQKEKVIGVTYSKDNSSNTLFALTTIDATADADLASQTNIDFTIGMEDYGGPAYGMGATLVFGLEGVSWGEVGAGLRRINKAHTGINNVSAWGFWEEMQTYKPRDPYIRFRGLNIGRQNDNSVLINTMYIFDFIHLSSESRQNAIKRGTAELEFLIPHMRKEVPGFQNATLSHVAEQLYIRETRHMQGLYRLNIDDVLEHRNFHDKIAWGSYPVDIQDISLEVRGYVIGVPKAFSVPFRCLVPQKLDGLLVSSRSASYDSLPHGSARVMPLGMAVSEAAGVAAFLRKENPKKSFQELAQDKLFIANLQALLKKQGAHLPELNIPYPIGDHWVYPYLQTIRRLGLAATDYHNNYKLDEIITGLSLQNFFNAAMTKKFGTKYPYCYCEQEGPVRLKDVALLFLNALEIKTGQDVIQTALDYKLLPKDLAPELCEANTIKRDELFYLVANYLESLANN